MKTVIHLLLEILLPARLEILSQDSMSAEMYRAAAMPWSIRFASAESATPYVFIMDT